MRHSGPGMVSTVLLFAALYSSLAFTFSVWGSGPSADSATTAMLWRGFGQHGFHFLSSWRYSQDNQLLSLMPLAGIVYSLFGISAYSVVGIGWLVFVLNALLLFALARRFVGLHSALFLAVIVLSANVPTIGIVGFLGFSQTHNISFVWSLLSLYAAARALGDNRSFWPAIFFLTVTVGAVSDAWFNAALTIPIICGSLILRRDTEAGPQVRRLGILALLAMLLASTKLLGLLAFVPSGHFHHAGSLSEVANNAVWLAKILAVFFNVTAAHTLLSWAGAAVYASMIAVLVLASLRNFMEAWHNYPIAQKFVMLTALLSIVVMTLAFIASSFPSGVNQSGRFLVNVFYFAPFFLALALLSRPTKSARVLGATCGAMFIGLSFTVNHGALVWQGPRMATAKGLARFLREHRLFHGYGPYYDVNANTVTWGSHFTVKVRPLMFANAPDARHRDAWHCPTCAALWVPNPNQDSRRWFRSQAARHRGRSFLVFSAGGLPCATVPVCDRDAIQEFGPPSRILRQGGFTILVFPRPLATYIARSVKRARMSWKAMNEARNRAAITKACQDLHWSCRDPQHIYSWLLVHRYAD